MKKRTNIVIAALAFLSGALAGFALRNSETADYNENLTEKTYPFDESAYFTDEYLQKAKKKRADSKKAKEARENNNEDH
jgi:hypothetical protein